MEVTATGGERCPNCFSPPLSGWRRLTFSLNPARYERRECEFCGTMLRIRQSEPIRKVGKFIGPALFVAWIAFDALDLPFSQAIALGAGGTLAVLMLFAVALYRLELIVELDDIPDGPAMERLREIDDDSR